MNKQPTVTVSLIAGRKHIKQAMNATRGINTIRDKDNAQKEAKWRLSDKTLLPMILDLHSPIEEMRFWIEVYAPNRVIDHLVRHEEIGKYVATSRTDIEYQTDNTNGWRYASFSINAKRLIEIMQQRLCNKAWFDTRKIMRMIASKAIEIEPLLYYMFVPKCVLYGFCPLLYRGCGKLQETIDNEHEQLLQDIKNEWRNK